MYVRAARRILVMACWCVMAAAGPAIARGVPPGAHLRVGRTLDAAAFERAMTRVYHVDVRNVVAADVDRDGDTDVIATSDDVIVFWVNDGQGSLNSSQPSTRSHSLDGRAPAPVLGGRAREGAIVSLQGNPASMTAVAAHGAPRRAVRPLLAPHSARRGRGTVACFTPRAPPR
jgi:hypothetical protein